MPHQSWRAAAAAAALLLAPATSVSAQQPTVQAPTAAGFTDAQLHDFARATLELDELVRGLGDNPTQVQREQASGAARAVLERHNLDVGTFNAIALQARDDEALAQRIRTMREQASTD